MAGFEKEKELEAQQQVFETQQVQQEESAQKDMLADLFGMKNEAVNYDAVSAAGGEEGSALVVKKVQEATDKNMPVPVEDLDSAVKERLREEQNKASEGTFVKKDERSVEEINYDTLQEAYWKTVEGFHNTADVKTAMGVRYSKFDDKDLFALRDELLNDSDRKSDSFMDMYNAVDALLSLSATKGKKTEFNRPEITKDFNEVFYTAKVQINQYVKAHSGFRFTNKGDRRMQVALRMQTLMRQLEKESERVKEEVLAKNVRMAGYRSEGLSAEEIEEREKQFNADAATEDLMRLIETKGFASEGNAEDANKAGEWIEKGYSQDLKELITSEEVAQADKERQNEFLAYLMDEENRKVANRMAVSILLEDSKDATLKMPWLKQELNDHLAAKLGDKTKEKTPEFVELAKKEIAAFKTENAQKIENYKARLDKVTKTLHLPKDASNLYDFSEMRELVTETDEAAFEEKLLSIREQVKTTDRMINEMLTEKYSVRTRGSIGRKLVKYMGALRVFGSSDQILYQTASFCDMLKFTAPEEYLEEKRIDENLKDLKIDAVRKDAFVNFLTDNDPEKRFSINDSKHKAKKKQYVKQMKANSKAFDKFVSKKDRMLSKQQWEALEELQLKNGGMTAEEFLAGMEKIATGVTEGDLLSRNEYLTDRNFRDAEKNPARVKHAKMERDAIEAMGTSMDKKFFIAITMEKDPLEKYRKLDALFAGWTEPAEDVKRREAIHAEREDHVRHILQKSGVPKNKWNEYVEKFARLIDGISGDGDGQPEDMRLAEERRNLERFGVRTWNEALEVMELVIPQMVSGEAKELDAATEQYQSSIEKLSQYDGGKYADYADLLMALPEVFAAMMNEDAATQDAFLKDVLDVRLKGFIEGVALAGTTQKAGKKDAAQFIPDAIRKQYAFAYLRRAYEGRLKGDGQFFAEDMENYSERVMKIKPMGDKTITENVKAIDEVIEKALYDKKKRGAEAIAITIAVKARMLDLMNSQDDFAKLFKEEDLQKYALEELDKIVAGVQENVEKDKIQKGIKEKFEDDLPEEDEAQKEARAEEKLLYGQDDGDSFEAREEIKDFKEEGARACKLFLGTDYWRLTRIRANNSLLRVEEKGMETANAKKADAMRGQLVRFCSAFELPPILKDALIEEGSAGVDGGIQSDRKKLKNHAFAMSKLYNLLTKEYKKDPAMSAEEASMYIVRLYGSLEERALFDNPEKYDMVKIRSTEGYAQFRQMYQALRGLESDESGDMDIERERGEMSKNLRTMMVTRVGLIDEKGKSIKDFQFKTEEEWIAYNGRMLTAIENGRAYLTRSVKVKEVIRKKLIAENSEKEQKDSDHYIERQTYAVYNFLRRIMMQELKDGEEFDEKKWAERFDEVRKTKSWWDNMFFSRDFVSSEEYSKFDSKHDVIEETEHFGNIIKGCANSSKAKTKAYEELDEDQKKVFALALMEMDISSIGYGTNGTAELLNAPSKKAKNLEKVEAALNKYVGGGGFDVEINYKEAFNKLFSTKEDVVVMTEEAFEKAMQFTKEITAKKLAFGEKDWTRLNDGYSSIMTAGAKYEKNRQINELDVIRTQILSMEDVRAKMLDYIKRDTFDIPVLKNIQKRFESMSKDDMKLFLRVMQDRSVLDVSAANDGSGEALYVDHEKRNALREALSGDAGTRASVMEGFDDPEGCLQVLINALSFQIRDDINSTGKDLTKENFVEGALERDELVDWDLIERAFDFMDEIKEKRTAVYALSHATDYINQSGNSEAIIENQKFTQKYKKKEDFKQLDFESCIKEQATKDGDEDIRRVVAGYHALTDKEKNLFFKVLARRDLLDISKKNYKSSFFGKKDRDYVNQAERDKLIDQYIASSLEGNIGVTLDENAYFNAMQSLFTTQIDDSEKLNSEKDIEKLMAAERNLFMLRSTAVDWKLFKRALNFVNRATEELEYAEGNAQLYRGAGNLVDNGKLDMSYSFLRKNFHRTGNQWARRIANIFERNIKEQVPVGDVLNILAGAVGVTESIGRTLGLRRSNSSQKGLAWLKGKLANAGATVNAQSQLGKTIQISALEVKTENDLTEIEKIQLKNKDKDKEEQEKEVAKALLQEKERRDNATFREHLAEGANGLVEQGGAVLDGVADTVDFLREELSETLANHFEAMSSLMPTQEVKQKADQNNIVEKTINKGQAPQEEPQAPQQKFAGKRATEVTGIIKGIGQAVVTVLLGTSAQTKEEGKEQETGALAEKTQQGAALIEQAIKKVVGEDMAKKLLDAEGQYYNIKESVGKYIQQTLSYLKYAQKCVKHVENIASSARNISLLNDGANASKDKREEDNKKLEKAKEKRLNEEQGEKAKNIVDKHRGMTGLAKELGVRLEKFNIAGDVINFAMETVSVAAGKLNVGQEILSKAIQEGLQFALFALQVASDRNALSHYFMDTEAGKALVDKTRNGFIKSGDEKMAEQLDESMKTQQKYGSSSFIDILSDARGYEHTSELVENTAMSMAQSIVFCASNYNPMAETRLMAITVMSVMGLDNEIGSVEPATVERLFKKFNMAR